MIATYENADCFLEDAENLQVRVGRAIQQDANGMQGRKSSQVKRILALSCEINVDLIEDAVSEIGLLV